MKPSIVRRPARWKLAAVAYGLAVLAAACGSERHPVWRHVLRRLLVVRVAAPATTPPNAVLCDEAAALRASLDKSSR